MGQKVSFATLLLLYLLYTFYYVLADVSLYTLDTWLLKNF